MTDASERSLHVVSIGEVLLDFVAPDAEDLGSAVGFIRAPGGAPANVVVAAARLGAPSGFVSTIGSDPFGHYLRGVLQDNGVDTSAVLEVPERTTLAFVARNSGGIPDFMFYRGADTVLRPEHVPADLLARTHFVHLSSMALLSEPSGSAMLHAGALGRRQGCLVSVDPNLRPSSWPSLDRMREANLPMIGLADVLKVNDEEARILTGSADLQKALDVMAQSHRLVVITLGPDGCLWRWKGETGRVESPRVDVVETTGAGDAFVGALLADLVARGYGAGHLEELPVAVLQEILRFAGAAGAMACTAPGAMASLPTRGEVEALLSGASSA